MNTNKHIFQYPIKAYAAYNLNKKDLDNSASGGIAIALCKSVISVGGVVAACVYNYGTEKLEYQIIDKINTLGSIQGSFYFQAYIAPEIFTRIKAELQNEKMVLVIGTACQILGIINYCRLNNVPLDKLITCDIMCHGVGNPTIWSKFNGVVKSRYGSKLSKVAFKDKQKGWLNPSPIAFVGKKRISLRKYSWLYFSNCIMRPSCYSCMFAHIERVSDLTIGDFWKVKQFCPEAYNYKGTSFIFVNSEKAFELIKGIQKDAVLFDTDVLNCVQQNMENATNEGKYRQQLLKDIKSNMNDSFFFNKWVIKLGIHKIWKKIKF